MIAIDANLLIYAYNSSSPYHQRAKRWLESILSGENLVRIPLQSILAFLRITTNSRIFEHPFSARQAVEIVDSWLRQPQVELLSFGPRHWSILRQLMPVSQATGPLVMDAHLAALSMEHGATLYTTDRDFTRFEGLSFENPLVQPEP